jgi:hypothetical protein
LGSAAVSRKVFCASSCKVGRSGGRGGGCGRGACGETGCGRGAGGGRGASSRREISGRLIAGRTASRACRADSASTLRIASSSASRSRVISDSSSFGCTLRSCATRAWRARS